MRERRRWAGRACLAAALACAALAVAAPARAQDEAPAALPDVFRGAASSFAASLEADREALLPIEDLFRFIALDGSSVYETDLQTARASILYPGNAVLLGPNLACGTFGGEAPPEFGPLIDACLNAKYPLSVNANGSNPDQATEGGLALGAPTDPVSAQAVTAVAHAAPDGSRTYSALKDLKVLGLPGLGTIELIPNEDLKLDSSILTVESALSRTDQHVEQGVLVVSSESVLDGVRMVGGLIRMGSIHSISRVTDDAAGTRTSEASFEIAGLTVGGVPAQLTDEGLVVGDPSGGTGPLQQQVQDALNQLLEALQVEITVLDTEQTPDDGTGQAVAAAGGLLIEVAADAEQLPILPGPLGDIDPNGTYVGSIQLGNTAASGGATSFAVDEVPIVDVPVDAGSDVVFDGGLPALDDGDVALPEVAAPAPEPAAEVDSGGGQQLVGRVVDLFGGRMGLVYLSFMFTVLSLCVLPRFTLPARLAGARL